MDGGFAPTFKEAVGRWRRRHRHPPANESWFAVHYRVGWLVERLNTLESIHLMRQGLDVRSLSAERPARKRKPDVGEVGDQESEASESDPEAESQESHGLEPEPVTPSSDAG
ncbi:MAG TPA: hypothetical protein VLS53_05025 [Candidatus Dormibacteraeota bacterium]|nr:hypothetical protein [Candidatus Dormibacteraeota bacterium]